MNEEVVVTELRNIREVLTSMNSNIAALNTRSSNHGEWIAGSQVKLERIDDSLGFLIERVDAHQSAIDKLYTSMGSFPQPNSAAYWSKSDREEFDGVKKTLKDHQSFFDRFGGGRSVLSSIGSVATLVLLLLELIFHVFHIGK